MIQSFDPMINGLDLVQFFDEIHTFAIGTFTK